MAKHVVPMEDSNRSANPDLHAVSDPQRRILVHGGVAAAVAGVFGPLAVSGCATPSPAVVPAAAAPGRSIGFKSVAMPVAPIDGVLVPEGYTARVLYRWGDPVGLAGNMPAFKADASNSASEQAAQAGMHHDAIEYFALDGSQRGLLAINHEYTDDGLLHTDGMKTWSAAKVKKAVAAHGISVIEVQATAQGWKQVLPSTYARRITGDTPMAVTGPAAGHALMRTAADPGGRRVLGTLNNCAAGQTPWGTYLTCEENFIGYFSGPEQPSAHEKRWGLKKNGWGYRWHEHDERFDATRHPNEPNRFGWVVEIDPADPASTPLKRTALGRAAHEGAAVVQTADGRAVVYMGEDARFEYIYKFVSRDRIRPGGPAANRDLLDHGTLYVARFHADGTGAWLPLVHGQGVLTAAGGFADQGEVLIKSRQASDALGATKMDRPEWTAVDPLSKEIYCTLTNNGQRGQPGRAAVDAANPRDNNTMGNIIRWKESGDFDAGGFKWQHFVLAGDPALARAQAQGDIKGDVFGSPDGLWVDARGVLWAQTDVSTSTLGKGDYVNLPNNQMLACDPTRGEWRRFLVGPAGCEVTGVVTTPDLRTMFIDIQHPGESPSERSDPDAPTRYSSWPDRGARPRSATVVITRKDGGVIGT